MQLASLLLTIALSFEPSSEPWGIDHDLPSKKPEKCEVVENKKDTGLRVGQKVCKSMIRFFQVCISPIDGPRSSFYPTSSQYAMDAIVKYGVFKGICMGCDRLMRENKDMWVYDRTYNYGPERKVNIVQ